VCVCVCVCVCVWVLGLSGGGELLKLRALISLRCPRSSSSSKPATLYFCMCVLIARTFDKQRFSDTSVSARMSVCVYACKPYKCTCVHTCNALSGPAQKQETGVSRCVVTSGSGDLQLGTAYYAQNLASKR